jgi:hypothetical protein
LNRKATEAERKQQFDIADYLIKLELEAFTKPKAEQLTALPAVETFVEVEQTAFVEYFSEPEQPKPECWEQEIAELEYYFKSIELPTQTVMLNGHTKISNCSLFIETNIATAKANNGKRTFLPYLNRLQELKQILTINLKQHESE